MNKNILVNTLLLGIILLPCFNLDAQQKSSVTLSLYQNPISNTIELIENSQYRIQAVVYKFEEKSLLDAIKKAHNRGVKIQLIIDAKEAKKNNSFIKSAKELGVKIRKWPHGKQHAKFTIIDEKTVITGSFNWTKAAKNKNLELIIIQDDKTIVDNFVLLFNDLWKKSKEK